MPETLDLHQFGRRLREARKQAGLSQKELAAIIEGVDTWISGLENGQQTGLAANTVYRFCFALNVSADYLMGLSDNPGRLLTSPTSSTRRRPRRAAGRQGAAEDV